MREIEKMPQGGGYDESQGPMPATAILKINGCDFALTHYPGGWQTIPPRRRKAAQPAAEGPGWFTVTALRHHGHR